MQISDFSEFFAALNGGHAPFPWQQRMVNTIHETASWPTQLNAPTGTGKSFVVEAHVFLTALNALDAGPRLPRRLAVCVDRRAMVDQHHSRAVEIASRLDAAESGILHEAAQALRALATASDAPMQVLNLRGGVPINREWLLDPSVCTVLAVTPDMWGSRILFRGYRSSRKMQPQEAGALMLDSAIVIDEAHLVQQLVATARDAAEIVKFDAEQIGVPGLQVVATSATLADEDSDAAAALTQADWQHPILSDRLQRPKPVTIQPTKNLTSKGPKTAYYQEIANAALTIGAQVESDPKPTIGVVVNTVKTALKVSELLQRQVPAESVVCWVGRMRPMDLVRAREEHPGLFNVSGDPAVRFLVATQTVEVGVDLDWAGLVTELAPASALAQRAGRVNRLGLREESPITVIAPETVVQALPYEKDDLQLANDWLHEISLDPVGMQVQRLAATPPPVAKPRREVITRLQPADVEVLAATTDGIFEEPDLTFHLDDELGQTDKSVGLVMRNLPKDRDVALALVQATPPIPEETFPTSVVEVKAIVGRLFDGKLGTRFLAFRWRSGQFSQLETADDIRPGDVVITDPLPIVQQGVVTLESGVGETPATVDGDASITVLCTGRTDPVSVEIGDQHRTFSAAEVEDLLEEISTADESADAIELVQESLLPGSADVQLAPIRLEDGTIPWVIVSPASEVDLDVERRQQQSSNIDLVTLDDHQQDVADRAVEIAERVGLRRSFQDSLARAGLLHDAGKADLRFQIHRLHGDGKAMLAKGNPGQQRRGVWRMTAELPVRWRHEQLSAAVAWADRSAGNLDDADLVTRLVGTSHGHGRPFFPHGASFASQGVGAVWTDEVKTACGELFGAAGGWGELIERTDRTYGVWGIAYLEALLRAADCSISAEGK